MRKRYEDVTDFTKPFTLKVFRTKHSWGGKLRYIPVHAEQFETPEAMMAEASKYDGTGKIVWTFGPDQWAHTPPESQSVDFDANAIPRDQRRVGALPFEIDEDMPF